jgi:hypothetical protein
LAGWTAAAGASVRFLGYFRKKVSANWSRFYVKYCYFTQMYLFLLKKMALLCQITVI